MFAPVPIKTPLWLRWAKAAEVAAHFGYSDGMPELNERSALPPGLHRITWDEFVGRFAFNDYRRGLAVNIQKILNILGPKNCAEVWIGGSFITMKPIPGDFDGIWRTEGVDTRDPWNLPLEITSSVEAQKDIYGGMIVPDYWSFHDLGNMAGAIVADKQGELRGVAVLDPRTTPPVAAS